MSDQDALIRSLRLFVEQWQEMVDFETESGKLQSAQAFLQCAQTLEAVLDRPAPPPPQTREDEFAERMKAICQHVYVGPEDIERGRQALHDLCEEMYQFRRGTAARPAPQPHDEQWFPLGVPESRPAPEPAPPDRRTDDGH